MTRTRRSTLLMLTGVVVALWPGGWAEAKKGGKPVHQASAQTARAISELAGKFKWGMSHEEALKVILDGISAKYDDRIKKESIASRQDELIRERNEAQKRVRDSYVKFDGQTTGWDVSIVDREFGHKNDESMLVIWEPEQRRFLFFHHDKLWKQFIALNAENPAFAGLTFDDFARKIQQRYGAAAMTFRKKRSSDEQTFDHLEWPPAGDHVLWAIDLTSFYGNFCLALMQRSLRDTIEKERAHNSPRHNSGSALVDQVTRPDEVKGDANSDVVDEITGHARNSASGAEPQPASQGKTTKKKASSENPLDGLDL